jgi:hypothetical protein
MKVDGIQTSRLPLLCPACANKELEIASPVNEPDRPGPLYRVACKRCEWREKYVLVRKESA